MIGILILCLKLITSFCKTVIKTKRAHKSHVLSIICFYEMLLTCIWFVLHGHVLWYYPFLYTSWGIRFRVLSAIARMCNIKILYKLKWKVCKHIPGFLYINHILSHELNDMLSTSIYILSCLLKLLTKTLWFVSKGIYFLLHLEY